MQGSDGNIYGTALSGGPFNGGVIFALELGLPKPAPRVLHVHPLAGVAGTRVHIWGGSLLGAAVEFNGVGAAEVTSSGPNYLVATVPAGASSGPITVPTPGGSVTPGVRFRID